MAVSALPRTHVRVRHRSPALSAALLALTLLAPALDLLSLVLPGVLSPMLGIVATAGGAAGLLLLWVRFPRTGWLAAATLTASTSLAMRLYGLDIAPLLSLLSVVALGLGGAFATHELAGEPSAA